MKAKLWFAGIITLFLAAAPGLAQAAQDAANDPAASRQSDSPYATPGVPTEGTQRVAQYPADMNRDLNGIGYAQRDAFSTKVEKKLDSLDKKADTLPQRAQQEFSQISDKVRSDLEKVDQVNQEDWKDYRKDMTNNINNLEQMLDSETQSLL